MRRKCVQKLPFFGITGTSVDQFSQGVDLMQTVCRRGNKEGGPSNVFLAPQAEQRKA
jgi:hypothetical protein